MCIVHEHEGRYLWRVRISVHTHPGCICSNDGNSGLEELVTLMVSNSIN